MVLKSEKELIDMGYVKCTSIDGFVAFLPKDAVEYIRNGGELIIEMKADDGSDVSIIFKG